MKLYLILLLFLLSACTNEKNNNVVSNYEDGEKIIFTEEMLEKAAITSFNGIDYLQPSDTSIKMTAIIDVTTIDEENIARYKEKLEKEMMSQAFSICRDIEDVSRIELDETVSVSEITERVFPYRVSQQMYIECIRPISIEARLKSTWFNTHELTFPQLNSVQSNVTIKWPYDVEILSDSDNSIIRGTLGRLMISACDEEYDGLSKIHTKHELVLNDKDKFFPRTLNYNITLECTEDIQDSKKQKLLEIVNSHP